MAQKPAAKAITKAVNAYTDHKNRHTLTMSQSHPLKH